MNASERRRLANVKERLQRNDCAGALRILQPLLPRKAKSAFRKGLGAAHRVKVAGKAKAHRMSTAEIRAACMERAKGECECGCGRTFDMWAPHLDHWLSGGGRKREKQSVEMCWMLTFRCHAKRQANDPSAEDWNRRFKLHCARNHLPIPTLHVVHAQVPAPQAPRRENG